MDLFVTSGFRRAEVLPMLGISLVPGTGPDLLERVNIYLCCKISYEMILWVNAVLCFSCGKLQYKYVCGTCQSVLCELRRDFLWSCRALRLLRLSLLTAAPEFGGGWGGSCLTKFIGLQKQWQGHKMSGQKENPDQVLFESGRPSRDLTSFS